MEELEVTGIVLNSIPYKEKDRLAHIFTVELGNITVVMRGISSPNAKNKFAAQPFCFGKFDLTKSHEFYVLKTAQLMDSFFDITSDYDIFKYCNSMLEICNSIMKPNIISEGLFLLLLKTLQNIVYNGIDYKLSVLKFYCDLLELIGYKLNFNICDNCNMSFIGNIKFDLRSGTFRCVNCSGGNVISNLDFTSLKIICSTPIDRLHTIKVNSEAIDRGLNLVLNNVSIRTSHKFKSIEIN